jgi:hypothetical protein
MREAQAVDQESQDERAAWTYAARKQREQFQAGRIGAALQDFRDGFLAGVQHERESREQEVSR